ncbi:hypothetical protein [Tenacibaculum sp. SZ-18]|uniref:hypothetical protein n=1 Tax=Tenacibaculum sp. SZ-18 TaxID=754423 RepID=UPI0012FDC8C8|nr:hypothetical protein [Tenacibaculum sp. SZ-18]
MRRSIMEDLKRFELSKKSQHKIYAMGGKLDGGVNTDGDEDCFPTQNKPPKKRNTAACL